MKVGRTYRHCCMVDLDFHITEMFLDAPSCLILNGWWVARDPKRKLVWGPDRITVKRDQVQKWALVEKENPEPADADSG